MSDLDPRVLELLRRSSTALGAYRDDLVLIGGLVQFFYPFHPDFAQVPIHPRATMDMDLATAPHLAIRGGRTVRDSLLDTDLVEFVASRPSSGNRPAASYFQRREDGDARRAEVHLEFIAPLRGPDQEAPIEPQPGLYAHALRRIDLLLELPITVIVPAFGALRLPHPLSFIAQKTLLRRTMTADPRKDLADAFFVLWGFQRWGDAIRDHYRHLCQQRTEWRTWMEDMRRRWEERADPQRSTYAEDVVAFYQDTASIRLMPEQVSNRVRAFLEHLH